MNTATALRSRIAAVLIGAATILAPTGDARADAPTAQGWWSAANVGVVALPSPPDVPDDGLLVQGSADAPLAFAALRYQLPAGNSATALVLTVAPETTPTPMPIRICRLVDPDFTPARGGPVAEAPAFDCATSVDAPLGADGATYTFDVAPFDFAATVGIAVVGIAPVDRVVLAAAGPDSLTTTGGVSAPAPAVEEGSRLAAAGTPAPTGRPDAPTAVVLPVAPGAALPAAPSAATALPPAPAVPAFAPTFAPLPGPEDLQPARALLVLVALTAGSALWARAGRDTDDEDPPATFGTVGVANANSATALGVLRARSGSSTSHAPGCIV